MKKEIRRNMEIRFRSNGRQSKFKVFAEQIHELPLNSSILFTMDEGDSLNKSFHSIATKICRMKQTNKIPANVSVCRTESGQVAIKKWDPLEV